MSFSKIFKLSILIISKTYGSNSDLDRLINSLSLWIIPGMKGVIMRYKLTTINLDYLYKTKEEKNMAGSRHSGEGSKLWVSKNKKKVLTQFHTVSFDWFLSGLEWILNLKLCLLKLLIFYQKILWNIRSSLNSSTFWVFRPVFGYVWLKLKLCAQKNKDLDQTYSYTGSKTQTVEELSLDLTFHNNFW